MKPDFAAIKERQQRNWAAGDYSIIGRNAVLACELLCEAVDLRAGQRVLDVATGSGNAALAAARRFCAVAAIDFVPALLERGRERAAAERLEVDFRLGDAEAIPFPDESFDVVLSTFGSMFTPNQPQAASELLRVCRGGGKIGMANWMPGGLVAECFRIITGYVPPPPGMPVPIVWGLEPHLRTLFGEAISSLQTERREAVFRYRSAEHWVDHWRTYFGPVVRAMEALEPAAREALAGDLGAAVLRFNRSGDETIVAPVPYLEVVAVKRRA